ncbi:hypothetical protein [Gymnodinialimonas hymeniacidonis]|uniref:hypothetical protein n=1 Tax=Gymnodinialimonas hymeniacidonis TaxID=3126508 RepID=UPI0034C62B7C
MLELPDALPPGALCAATPAATGKALRSAFWWHGSTDAMEVDPKSGAATLWRSQGAGPPAEPTEPNEGNGQIGEVDDLIGLQCKAQTHCGMVAEAVTPDAATATLAVRFYTPPGEDARTLLTLNTGDNYIFLSETAGTLTAKDDQDLISIDLPCPPQDAPRMAIVSLFGDQLALSLGPNRADGKAGTGILKGEASLFIGCRNQRPRLLKTLGSALILDVWFFPNRALLHEQAAPELKALKRHHLWAAA